MKNFKSKSLSQSEQRNVNGGVTVHCRQIVHGGFRVLKNTRHDRHNYRVLACQTQTNICWANRGSYNRLVMMESKIVSYSAPYGTRYRHEITCRYGRA